ncbi:hypothetical protein R9J51_20130 (plasmid) [Novosphingobium rhizosphaerae]
MKKDGRRDHHGAPTDDLVRELRERARAAGVLTPHIQCVCGTSWGPGGSGRGRGLTAELLAARGGGPWSRLFDLQCRNWARPQGGGNRRPVVKAVKNVPPTKTPGRMPIAEAEGLNGKARILVNCAGLRPRRP